MLRQIKVVAKRIISKHRSANLDVKWIKKDSESWLWNQHLKDDFSKPKRSIYHPLIENLAKETDQLGPQALWDGYGENDAIGPTRMPNMVRVSETMGNFFSYLVQQLEPHVIVEFGTAFGVSGMYFLAGLEYNQKGKLLTFEPNDGWRHLAIHNLTQISDRFDSISGTFEENISKALLLDQGIDLAFIDAVHTKEFVVPQLETVIEKSSDHAIIILDDINFSHNMRECWEEVSKDARFLSSVAICDRVGILELIKS